MIYDNEYWQDCIDEIVDEFDFEKVHKCMQATGWQWAEQGTGRLYYPEIGDIRRTARRLLREKRDICTAGFRILWDKEDGSISMEFIVADWCAYKEESAA